MKASLEYIVTYLKKGLKPKRFQHTLGVRDLALTLSEKLGLDSRLVEITALLHDVGKSMELSEQIFYAKNMEIPLSDDDLKSPSVIHGRVGADIAQKAFGIDNREVLDAISYHTAGHDSMSLLARVLFASDYLDPNRDFEGQKTLTQMTMEDFENGVLEIIKNKIAFVMQKNYFLHPDSVLFYNAQLELLQKRNS